MILLVSFCVRCWLSLWFCMVWVGCGFLVVLLSVEVLWLFVCSAFKVLCFVLMFNCGCEFNLFGFVCGEVCRRDCLILLVWDGLILSCARVLVVYLC